MPPSYFVINKISCKFVVYTQADLFIVRPDRKNGTNKRQENSTFVSQRLYSSA